jgi:two-component system, OmpR family, phosphate regulon sensor histidine kinase PhoR
VGPDIDLKGKMRSLRWRFVIPYVILLILVLSGLSIYLSSYLRQTYLGYWRTTLMSEARLIAENIVPSLKEGPPYTSLQNQVAANARLLNVRITLILPDGKVISDSSTDAAAMENHLTRPEVQQALRGQEDTQTRISGTLNTQMLYAAVPVRSGSQIIGVARLSVSLQEVESNLATVRSAVTGFTILIILLAGLLTFLLTNYTIEPLQHLTAAARRLSVGEFGDLPDVNRQDEIGELNRAFHQMTVQLKGKITELEMERGKMSAVLSNMTDGVMIVDHNGNVQLINPAAARMFGIQSEEAPGHSLIEVSRQHQMVDLWHRSSSSGEQKSSTIEITIEKNYIQAIATPLGDNASSGVLLVLQDLTRIRRLEMVRRDFVSNVSHELRTPLASLKALAETLQEGALEDPPAARRFLLRMESEIDTLTQLVQELLELSRIESGRVPLEKKSISPHDLLNRSVERMQLQAERAGINLHLELAENLPNVNADRVRMEQVLVNLLHNAIKFTPPGGDITVSAYANEKDVVLYVQDSGVGISEEALPRIFERFYKADRARSGGGTGLGLSIARHLVEAHGGRIWAESTQGKGSTFYFSLPKI